MQILSARLVLAAIASCLLAEAAQARPARCFTDEEGRVPCDFRATDRDGSFGITARGKPTYLLNMIEPGVAAGFMNLGTRNVALPGRYLRSRTEPGCWVNDATQTKICAR